MMPKIAGLVEEMTGLRFVTNAPVLSDLTAGAAVRWIAFHAPAGCGFRNVAQPESEMRPDQDALELCREHGREIARHGRSRRCRSARLIRWLKKKPRHHDVRPRPTDAMQRLPVDLDPAKGEPMQDVAPGTPWSEVRITSSARNAPSAKTSLTNWLGGKMSNGIVIIGSGFAARQW